MPEVVDIDQDFDALVTLEVPEFKANIPAHLLSGLTPGERYQVETLSIVAQAVEWNTSHILHQHKLTRLLYLRTAGLVMLTKKWTWPIIFLGWLAPYWIPKLISMIHLK